MKIVICEEDYTLIEAIHSTLSKYAKQKGINAEFNLTTRKATSIERFLQKDKAECYYISLNINSEMSGIELIDLISQNNPHAKINILAENESDFANVELEKYNIFKKIIKDEHGNMKDHLKQSLDEVYANFKASDFTY
ncbi:response regulator [Kurthia sibirica]|uniref:Response regulatory domain-containing protein n=1 Tax=Kurthia sibirica TaxID=202750 RepID=A0A2U3AN66_9BACL|nr:response regulator [Kurthia sibirica]PWI25984.1 hypothetical protein DEX24_05485 [Kurthia sibirica]GEK34983.1 hypothetical protein KSI01_25160 [Kurthia sibirica]